MPTMWPRRSWACLLGVTDDRGLNDIGELTGAVRYDGQTLSLNPAELTYQEIA